MAVSFLQQFAPERRATTQHDSGSESSSLTGSRKASMVDDMEVMRRVFELKLAKVSFDC